MKNSIVFSLYSNKKVAGKVANIFDAELGEVYFDHFADGELLVKTMSNVTNKNVIIIESTAKKAHERLFELLLLVDSIKRSNPKSLKLYIPYFGYSRQERVSWINEPVSCEVVANILDTTKVDKILTFDIHHPDIKKFFKIDFESIDTTTLFADYYKKYIKKHKIDPKKIRIVSPDHGSNNRADALTAEIKGSKKVILSKHRPAPNFVEHFDVENDVSGCVCIIIDDIIDTGGTILSATDLLLKKGAASVLVGASHAVLSKNSIKTLINSKLEDIVVTNTIERRLPKQIHVLDISRLIKLD